MFTVLGRLDEITEKRARLLLRDAIVADAGLTGDGDIRFKSFVESVWLPLHKSEWRPSSEETILKKLEALYKHFGEMGVSDITPVILQQYLDGLVAKYSASTVRMAHAYLRSILKEAVEQDFIRKNPARLVRVPKNLRVTRRPFLSLDEISALLEAAKPFGVLTREGALLETIFSTALRPSELLALKWCDLDLTPERSTLLLRRSIYRGQVRDYTKVLREGESKLKKLPELAARVLAQWREESIHDDEDDYVFCDSRGGFLHAGNLLHRVLQPLAKQAKIKTPLSFQILRRTVLTHAASEGSLKDVQELAGHKQAQITAQIYMQVIDESARKHVDKVAEKILNHKPAQAAK
jgi:integrase/recombinase XerC